jgi:hypothetical protein
MRSERTVPRASRAWTVALGLLAGAALATWLLVGWGSAPVPQQGASTPPSERIDVEQAVDFPYDI